MSRPSGRRTAIFKLETGIFIISTLKTGRLTWLRKARFSVVDVKDGRGRDVPLDIFKEENVERGVAAGISLRGAALTRLSNADKDATSVEMDGVVNVGIVKTGVGRRRFAKKERENVNSVSSVRKRLRIKSRKPKTPRGASVAFNASKRRVDDETALAPKRRRNICGKKRDGGRKVGAELLGRTSDAQS